MLTPVSNNDEGTQTMAKKTTRKGAHLGANRGWVDAMMSSKGRNLTHDSRPKRARTRAAQRSRAILEW